LVLIHILPLPLLVPGAILGIVSGVATRETPVVIRLAVLLLLIVPLSWKLGAVGCLLLLLLWSDHPSPLLLLLLGSPESCLELPPFHLSILWLHGKKMVPPCPCGSAKLLGGEPDFSDL
jgi:hypothetical protein